MKALVVYDSASGNTDKVAQAICSGMRQMGLSEVECKAANSVTMKDLSEAEVWVMGSPNGFLAGRKVQGVLRKAAGSGKHRGVAFDTRSPGMTTGSAQKIAQAMQASGIDLLGWTYFSLGPNKALMEGEEGMAVVYGRNLATSI